MGVIDTRTSRRAFLAGAAALPLVACTDSTGAIAQSDTAELITLRYYGQLSFKELAQLRNEPIGTTLSKVHRGVKKLREIMEAL